ncbi:GPW/gp25 family protein [Nitrosospira sp. Is2]|uniref:GPW/gp25 family protein n=1 Tax=Nitrosospira sp. Is2 TaxID=3080532 RepID=UPI002954BDF3|nr:GPW/gp25 family protein [Nitrosospira sp. Is2]WON73517.1 GPW/gp25 family protein [Nitrosospira sp. Is2]
MSIPVLGVGWGFPVKRADDSAQASAHFVIAEYEESVRQSIVIILSTAKGERVMRPDFGSGLSELVFAVNNAGTRAMAEFEVREALEKWEPRIDVLGVESSTGGDRGEQLMIFIDYRVRTTDNRYNMVYPFYLDRPLT